MSILKRPAFPWSIVACVVIAIAAVGALTAQTPSRLSASQGGAVAEPLTGVLPPVVRGPMTTTHNSLTALCVLTFDDGTCESGLGAGTATTVTDLVDWDVPTSFPGLQVVAVTTRMNTGQNINNFAFAQSGATPPPVGGVNILPLTASIPAAGPCPATALTSRAINGAATISGTNNFFAGVQASGFVGRDTNGPSAGRMWLLCGTCGMTQYSPTDLVGIGLGGNWMIRIVVETFGPDCIPVELMDFTVVDG